MFGKKRLSLLVSMTSCPCTVARERPFLNMDVRGFEKEVLNRASRTLSLLVGIQIELSFAPLYEGGMM